MNSTLWWYVARSSGLVAWFFLVATLMLGTLASGKLVERKGARRWLLDLHPYLAGLSLLFVALHIVAIVSDHIVPFSWTDVIVPFAASWRPVAVAWGVIGLWLLAAIQLTSLARKHMPKRVWHAIHLTSYGLCAVTTIHAVTAGTDLGVPLVGESVAGAVALAMALSLVRLARAHLQVEPTARAAARPSSARVARSAPAAARPSARVARTAPAAARPSSSRAARTAPATPAAARPFVADYPPDDDDGPPYVSTGPASRPVEPAGRQRARSRSSTTSRL
jgi:methionine sulfoxide reductase heme-binding subunit